MKKIEVKFPEIKGMKVSGAALDFENGCSVVEYVEEVEFKKGDIVYCEYNDLDKLVSWITLVKNVLSLEPEDTKINCHALYMISTNTGRVTPYLELDTDQSADCSVRLATSSEKQLLFDALEKDGKYWDAEALEVKEYEIVPDDIGIYCCNRQTLYNKGDELYIGFNDDKQLLSTSDGIYTVNLNDANVYSRIDCYLKPISCEYVKVGDTILCGDKDYLTNYFKVIENGCVYTSDENDVYTFGRFGSQDKLFKLIPVK